MTPGVPWRGVNMSGMTNSPSPPPITAMATKVPISTFALGRLRGRGVPEAKVTCVESNVLPQLPQKASAVVTGRCTTSAPFSFFALMMLEESGFCGRAEVGQFVESGGIDLTLTPVLLVTRESVSLLWPICPRFVSAHRDDRGDYGMRVGTPSRRCPYSPSRWTWRPNGMPLDSACIR